jgi:quinol monooxygenase YgiN
MPTFLVRHRVADYDAWRAVYDGAGPMQQAAGVTDAAVYRDADDPNVVLVLHRFGSRDQAEAFMANEDAKATMAAAGVDPASIRVEVYEDPS